MIFLLGVKHNNTIFKWCRQLLLNGRLTTWLWTGIKHTLTSTHTHIRTLTLIIMCECICIGKRKRCHHYGGNCCHSLSSLWRVQRVYDSRGRWNPLGLSLGWEWRWLVEMVLVGKGGGGKGKAETECGNHTTMSPINIVNAGQVPFSTAANARPFPLSLSLSFSLSLSLGLSLSGYSWLSVN